jgi:hypothetical protein
MDQQEGPVNEGGAGLPMPEDAAFLRAQAQKCRWLAARVTAPDVADTLRQMAREYDARAERREGRPGERKGGGEEAEPDDSTGKSPQATGEGDA